ncbi:N-acetyl sugar amidotransferase [uncultured Desulfovibrio sp.]|uniref:N-acetyl sugar amidotransferase n=1 Tax=uncultured Desulfovibrio sp. TaxID=167968 RepID=UPI00260DF888|nr:N-acetyl sugar amidotransferase [uncultured Desulfovibrio sp.]
MQNSTYRICTRCVMDTSDPEITFDAQGHCNHCTEAIRRLEQSYMPDARGQEKLEKLIEEMRRAGKGKEYDCLIGLSGGVDSSWLTYKSREWGLRPLVFHVDAGWDSPIAAQNVQRLVRHLGYELHTFTVDWEEMRDLQRAYLQSGLSNQDVPQDHAFFAVLFHTAARMGLRYWLSGFNLVTESILPRAWEYMAMDSRQLKAIHGQFGQRPLRNFPTLSFWDCCKFYNDIPFFPTVKAVTPLHWMPYSADEARSVLHREVGWENYGRKHSESIFTKFFQNYYQPTKFGFDKRRAHLSSLIASGQMTRAEALAQLEEPLYDPEEFRADKALVLDRLGLTEAEWDRLLALPNHSFRDYPNWSGMLNAARNLKIFLRRIGIVK